MTWNTNLRLQEPSNCLFSQMNNEIPKYIQFAFYIMWNRKYVLTLERLEVTNSVFTSEMYNSV